MPVKAKAAKAMSTVDSAKENRPSAQNSYAKASKRDGKNKRALSFSNPFVKNRSKYEMAPDDVDDDDPVMALFAARNTQRVRFRMEGSPLETSLKVEEEQQQQQQQTVKARTDAAQPRSKRSNENSSHGIKHFMKDAIFGKSLMDSGSIDELDRDMAGEIESVGLSPGTQYMDECVNEEAHGILQTPASDNANNITAFVEDKAVRSRVTKLLNKASRARYVYFRYEYAVKVCVKALELVTEANYPDGHPTVTRILQSLNTAHHSLSSYRNSANIVRMGIRYEDAGELVRALKMYSIAYRIRRDNLSSCHPSLVVLLNMLGSVQMKREELEEAMEIFEIAVKDESSDDEKAQHYTKPSNLLAKSVAYREMGTIYERWQEPEDALGMYDKSLECLALFKGIAVAPTDSMSPAMRGFPEPHNEFSDLDVPSHHAILLDLESAQMTRSYSKHTSIVKANKHEDDENESGGLELLMSSQEKRWSKRKANTPTFLCTSGYDVFFPHTPESNKKKKSTIMSQDSSIADIDIALTLHQIGQLHRSNGDFNLAIEAYSVAFRGMKHVLGKHHPNCASILGNIGNLQKEMGDMEASYETYQKVLAIESSRLGMSHPDVVITLHNIATIDAARGHHSQALVLYDQVTELQKKLFGDDHITLAVTTACKGDVFERIGLVDDAIECFEEALRIKTVALGRHSMEVARLLHKLGKLNAQNADFHVAESFISRAILVYRLNKIPDDDEWLVDAGRDAADIDAAISMGKAGTVQNVFEC